MPPARGLLMGVKGGRPAKRDSFWASIFVKILFVFSFLLMRPLLVLPHALCRGEGDQDLLVETLHKEVSTLRLTLTLSISKLKTRY